MIVIALGLCFTSLAYAKAPADLQERVARCVKVNRCLVWNRSTGQTKCISRRVNQGQTYCQQFVNSKYTVFSR